MGFEAWRAPQTSPGVAGHTAAQGEAERGGCGPGPELTQPGGTSMGQAYPPALRASTGVGLGRVTWAAVSIAAREE